jgi:antirestriction protein
MTETGFTLPFRLSFASSLDLSPHFVTPSASKKPNSSAAFGRLPFVAFPLKCNLYLRCPSLNTAYAICNATSFDSKEYCALGSPGFGFTNTLSIPVAQFVQETYFPNA